MNEKENLEGAACDCFLDSYNATHACKFYIVRHQDKPDFIVQDFESGESLGIEVTHLYFDGKEAKMVLGRQPHELHGVMTLDALIQKLNADLAEKVTRAARYEYVGKLVLLIRVASPIFDKQDFEMYADDICVPELNTFAEIWLLFYSQETKTYSDLMQIL